MLRQRPTTSLLGDVVTDADGLYLVRRTCRPGVYTGGRRPATLPVGGRQTFDADGRVDHLTAPRRSTLGDDRTWTSDFGYTGTGRARRLRLATTSTPTASQDAGEPGIAGVDGHRHLGRRRRDAGHRRRRQPHPSVATGADGLYLVDNLPAGPVRVTVDTATLPAGLDGHVRPRRRPRLHRHRDVRRRRERRRRRLRLRRHRLARRLRLARRQRRRRPGRRRAGHRRTSTVTATWAGCRRRRWHRRRRRLRHRHHRRRRDLPRRQPPGRPRARHRRHRRRCRPGVVATFDLDGGDDSTADRTLGRRRGRHRRRLRLPRHRLPSATSSGSTSTATASRTPASRASPSVDVTATWAGFDGDARTPPTTSPTPPSPPTPTGCTSSATSRRPRARRRRHDDAPARPRAATFDLDGGDDSTADRTLGRRRGRHRRRLRLRRRQHRRRPRLARRRPPTASAPTTPPPDPTEPGVPGQLVVGRWSGFDNILDTPDDVVAVTITDADGRWGFDGVPDGLGRVTLVGGPRQPSSPSRAIPTPPSTASHERTIPTADDLDIDFGLAGEASVGDLVWLDVDGDDVAGPRRAGHPGRRRRRRLGGLRRRRSARPTTSTTPRVTTDADGLYLVERLPPGAGAGDGRPEHRAGRGSSPSFDLDGGDDETADRDARPRRGRQRRRLRLRRHRVRRRLRVVGLRRRWRPGPRRARAPRRRA